MVIKGIVEGVKVLKENTGKNKDGKFLEVTISGKKYLSFDKAFVGAEGLESEFPTKISEYGGKTNTYVDVPKIKDDIRPRTASDREVSTDARTLNTAIRALEILKEYNASALKAIDVALESLRGINNA